MARFGLKFKYCEVDYALVRFSAFNGRRYRRHHTAIDLVKKLAIVSSIHRVL